VELVFFSGASTEYTDGIFQEVNESCAHYNAELEEPGTTTLPTAMVGGYASRRQGLRSLFTPSA
jgi:hypothetical protein